MLYYICSLQTTSFRLLLFLEENPDDSEVLLNGMEDDGGDGASYSLISSRHSPSVADLPVAGCPQPSWGQENAGYVFVCFVGKAAMEIWRQSWPDGLHKVSRFGQWRWKWQGWIDWLVSPGAKAIKKSCSTARQAGLQEMLSLKIKTYYYILSKYINISQSYNHPMPFPYFPTGWLYSDRESQVEPKSMLNLGL